jgi:hypothetical protein
MKASRVEGMEGRSDHRGETPQSSAKTNGTPHQIGGEECKRRSTYRLTELTEVQSNKTAAPESHSTSLWILVNKAHSIHEKAETGNASPQLVVTKRNGQSTQVVVAEAESQNSSYYDELRIAPQLSGDSHPSSSRANPTEQ